jgi:hypothetical protein
MTGLGNDWEVKQEDFIAVCMKKGGLEYYPRDVKPLADGHSDIVFGVPPGFFTVDIPWLPDDLAGVERYGYGHSDSPEPATGGGGVVNVPTDAPVDPDPGVVLAQEPEGDWEFSLPAPVRNPHGAWVLAEAVGPDGGFWLGKGQVPAEYRSLTGTPKEVEVAVADFRCRQRTDYVDQFLAIMREAQDQFVASNQMQLNAVAASIERYLTQ